MSGRPHRPRLAGRPSPQPSPRKRGEGAHRVRASRTSPHPSLAPLPPPEPLVLPRKPAGGDAHDLLRVGDGGADHLRRAAVRFEDRERALGVGGVDHVAEADAHVEDFEHLAVVDARVALDEGKDGLRLNKAVDLVADGGGDAGEVEQAVAGDVDQRVLCLSPNRGQR
jgi:hypothetical protein